MLTIILLAVCIALIAFLLTKTVGLAKENGRLFETIIRLDARIEEQVRRSDTVSTAVSTALQQQQNASHGLQQILNERMAGFQSGFDARQIESLKILQESMQSGQEYLRRQVSEALVQNNQELTKRFDLLTQSTEVKLQEISGQVERRLSEGFEKTTATFTDVIKRLALIDEAQKKIAELSGNVISLQEVLADKRARGVFGEVQLEAIVRNMLPENAFKFQYRIPTTEKEQRIVDCMLFLPEPTGNVPIDSKFPLESFRKLMDNSLSDIERKSIEKQFKMDLRKHINDISSKYIVAGQTADGAMMFIPAESIFAEIHAHHPDIVEEAQRARVWLTSPTTLMAVLTTARAVIKDAATRKQVHIIQDHLVKLSKDFERFQKRMNDLATHIRQAHEDVGEVSISARKITSHFEKIEKVELLEGESALKELSV